MPSFMAAPVEVHRVDSERSQPAPLVSVVIPTHDRRESLLSVLTALARQTMDPADFEVVVVCDGCTDDSAAAARALDLTYRLSVIEQPGQGPASARNRALAQTTGEVIVFIDDDVIPTPELLQHHLDEHRRDAAAVVIGPLLAPADYRLDPWTQWEANTLKGQYEAMTAGRWSPTPRQFYTGNASARRAHLVASGGFDTGFRRAEDVELAYRLQAMNLKFVFAPAAAGWHRARRPLRSWIDAARAYGHADVAMYRRGRLMTLQSMATEFQWRNRWLRRAARAFVGRPRMLGATIATMVFTARLATAARIDEVADRAYSAVFNLSYWDGVAESMGGRQAFWGLVRTGTPPPPEP